LFFKKQKEQQKKLEKLEYENSTLSNTLYNIQGNLIYNSQLVAWAQNKTSTFTVPSDPYVIYKTCAQVGSAVRKITNWISKYSWNLDLDNISERESFTSIVRKTVRSLLGFGNTFWDISNGLIYVLPTDRIKVKWDDLDKTSNKSPEFKSLTGTKKYYMLDKDGNWQPLETENIVHFILDVDCLEIKGSSLISTMQNEINVYYYYNNFASKKYNSNETPKFLANFGPDMRTEDLGDLKQKFMLNQNPDEPFFSKSSKMDIYEFNQDSNFGSNYTAFMDYFGNLVYFVFGMSETDRGQPDVNRATAQVHEHLTQSTLIEPILDVIAEEWNQSKLKTDIGNFEWRAPEIETAIDTASGEPTGLRVVKKGNEDAI